MHTYKNFIIRINLRLKYRIVFCRISSYAENVTGYVDGIFLI